jgi:acid phosphatase (class A)
MIFVQIPPKERNMKRISRIFFALFFTVLFSKSMLYASAKVYVPASDIDLTEILPPPPAQDSIQTKKEIAEILDFQENRSDKMVQYAQADQEISVFRFSDILGDKFTKENLPFTGEFFHNVTATASIISGPAKDFWKRPRPSVFDPRVKPCVKVPPNASYPSGHSTAGNLMAIILANMVPEKSAEIYGRGWDFAVNRIIGGVHYRSDSEAGRMAATVIAAFMFRNADFKADYERSKSEIRRLLGYEVKTAAATGATGR